MRVRKEGGGKVMGTIHLFPHGQGGGGGGGGGGFMISSYFLQHKTFEQLHFKGPCFSGHCTFSIYSF